MSGSGENTPASFLNEVSLNYFSHDYPVRFLPRPPFPLLKQDNSG